VSVAQGEHVLGNLHEAPAVRDLRELVGCGLRHEGELAVHHRSELHEALDLARCERSRLLVDHAERADTLPVGAMHGMARVETDVRLVRHERVVGKPRILAGILDDECGLFEDRVTAERELAARLARLQPLARFEPLPVPIHEAHERDRDIEQPARQARDAVEAFLGVGVEDSQIV
jgi:hypothetical protein